MWKEQGSLEYTIKHALNAGFIKHHNFSTSQMKSNENSIRSLKKEKIHLDKILIEYFPKLGFTNTNNFDFKYFRLFLVFLSLFSVLIQWICINFLCSSWPRSFGVERIKSPERRKQAKQSNREINLKISSCFPWKKISFLKRELWE